LPRINVCSQTQMDSTALTSVDRLEKYWMFTDCLDTTSLTSVDSLQQYWMFTDTTGHYFINICR